MTDKLMLSLQLWLKNREHVVERLKFWTQCELVRLVIFSSPEQLLIILKIYNFFFLYNFFVLLLFSSQLFYCFFIIETKMKIEKKINLKAQQKAVLKRHNLTQEKIYICKVIQGKQITLGISSVSTLTISCRYCLGIHETNIHSNTHIHLAHRSCA